MSSRHDDGREPGNRAGRAALPRARDQPPCAGTGARCLDGRSRAEVFALLGNEDRLAIVDAVVRAHRRGDAPVAFSTLRAAAGIGDSGRFSYHLEELVGPLLVREGEGEGYALDEAVSGPLRRGAIECDDDRA